jgi:hypothetical protein
MLKAPPVLVVLDFSNPCCLRPGPYRYFLRAGTSRVPQSISSKPPVLWTQGCWWV